MAVADPKPDQEPSIEEILESIRQIISDDGSSGGQETTAGSAPLAPAPEGPSPAAVPLSLTPDQAPAAASTLNLSAAPEKPTPPDKPYTPPQASQSKDTSSLDLSPPKAPPAPVNADMDILDLVEKVESDKLAPVQPPPAPQPAIKEMSVNPTVDKPMTMDKQTQDTLISAQTADAATESLLKLLAGNIAVEKEDPAHPPGKVTLEDMTRELMKPLIKIWLDQNLPGIIEKIVQKEVEKLSRRAMDR